MAESSGEKLIKIENLQSKIENGDSVQKTEGANNIVTATEEKNESSPKLEGIDIVARKAINEVTKKPEENSITSIPEANYASVKSETIVSNLEEKEKVLDVTSKSEINSVPKSELNDTVPKEDLKELVAPSQQEGNLPKLDNNNLIGGNLNGIDSISEKEKELLDVVFSLESEKQTLIEQSKSKIIQLRKELEDTKFENEKLQKLKSQLEQNLKQAVTGNVDNSPKTKQEFEDVLIQAKTLLFEKTKECKQKEQHIETLKCQVGAVKEVLSVTKEMLNLRTIEMEHLQSRLDDMGALVKAEREKSVLFEKKLSISQKVYDDLKKEYNFQAQVFKELKEAYEQKIDVLNKTIEKLK